MDDIFRLCVRHDKRFGCRSCGGICGVSFGSCRLCCHFERFCAVGERKPHGSAFGRILGSHLAVRHCLDRGDIEIICTRFDRQRIQGTFQVCPAESDRQSVGGGYIVRRVDVDTQIGRDALCEKITVSVPNGYMEFILILCRRERCNEDSQPLCRDAFRDDAVLKERVVLALLLRISGRHVNLSHGCRRGLCGFGDAFFRCTDILRLECLSLILQRHDAEDHRCTDCRTAQHADCRHRVKSDMSCDSAVLLCFQHFLDIAFIDAAECFQKVHRFHR